MRTLLTVPARDVRAGDLIEEPGYKMDAFQWHRVDKVKVEADGRIRMTCFTFHLVTDADDQIEIQRSNRRIAGLERCHDETAHLRAEEA